MTHQIAEIGTDLARKEVYKLLLLQVEAVIADESDLIANLANVAALLKYGLNFFWVGFYIEREGELVLGPYQGPLACSRISFGKGVCGTSAQNQQTIVVPDVNEFPGHIACSADSKSEIVVPLVANKKTQLILDLDSVNFGDFTELDAQYLEAIIDLISKRHFGSYE